MNKAQKVLDLCDALKNVTVDYRKLEIDDDGRTSKFSGFVTVERTNIKAFGTDRGDNHQDAVAALVAKKLGVEGEDLEDDVEDAVFNGPNKGIVKFTIRNGKILTLK